MAVTPPPDTIYSGTMKNGVFAPSTTDVWKTSYIGNSPFRAPTQSTPTAPTTQPQAQWQLNSWSAQPAQPGYNPGTQPSWNYSPAAQTPYKVGTMNPYEPTAWQDDATRGNMKSYLENFYFPQATLQQNAYQYITDSTEAQRRWNEQFGWTQKGDVFNQNLAVRQQQSAEEQARLAQSQWSSEFGQTQLRDTRTWEEANRQFGLSQELGRGQLAVDQRANEIEAAYKKGLITNEERNLSIQKLAVEGQNTRYQGQTQNEARANEIDSAYKRGLITVQQRETALAELTQRQNYELAKGSQGIDKQLADIEQRYREGMISNEQRNLEIQSAQQVAQQQYWQGQLSNEATGLQIQQKLADVEGAYKKGLISNEQRALALQKIEQDRQFGLSQELGRGQLSVDKQLADVEQQYKIGLISNEQRNLQIQALQQKAQQEYQTGQLSNERRGQDIQAELGRRSNDIEAAYRQGLISNEQRQLALAELTQQQSYGLDTQRLGLETQLGMGQLGVAQQEVQIEQAYRQGLISNEQRQLALAELTQQQTYGLETSRFGLETELGRGQLQLSERELMLMEAYRQAQLAQEAQLSRERLGAEERMASMASYGRRQAPTARYIRNWG